MPEGDGLPFGRSRRRAYDGIMRALVRSTDDCDEQALWVSAHPVRDAEGRDRASVGRELDALRNEISRVQSALRDIKTKRYDAKGSTGNQSESERQNWSVMERSTTKRVLDVNACRNVCNSSRARDDESHDLMLRQKPEPSTRGMAVMLSRRLDEVLPEGAIERKCSWLSKQGGLGATSEEIVNASSLQIDAFRDDFAVIDAALREGARQVSAGCRDRGEMLDVIRERYGELFSTMRNVCDRWLRRNTSLMIEIDGLKGALSTKEMELIDLTEYATRCRYEAESAKRQQQSDNERADLISKRSRDRERELMTMQDIDRAELRRLHERVKLAEVKSRRDIERAIVSMEDSLHQALNDRDELSKRITFLDYQLHCAQMMLPDKSAYATSETQTTTEDAENLARTLTEEATTSGVHIAIQTDRCAFVKRRRKDERVFDSDRINSLGTNNSDRDIGRLKREALGGFAALISSQRSGRRKPRAWVLKCIAHIYTDKLVTDATTQVHAEDPNSATSTTAQPLANLVYDWHMHKFGLRQLAETNLLDLIASTSYHAGECGIIAQFSSFCGFGQWTAGHTPHHHRMLTDASTVAFYLQLLDALSSESNLAQLFIEFGMSNDSKLDVASSSVSSIALPRALDAIKRMFVDYGEDVVALRDFVAARLGLKNITGSTNTVAFATVIKAVMDEYRSRRAINLETLRALFRAADCDDDGALLKDEFAAAFRFANAKITDAVISKVFESCSNRKGDNSSPLSVDIDAFIKACFANGLERFRLVPEPPPSSSESARTSTSGSSSSSRKKQTSSGATSSSIPSSPTSSNAWFALVEAHMASPEGPIARLAALSQDAKLPLDRCRRQSDRLNALITDRTDGEAAYIALKLLNADLRAAALRSKGGFRRLGVAVLHQVSFSMRAERDTSRADAETTLPSSPERALDPCLL